MEHVTWQPFSVGATSLVPCHEVKSLQLIWRSGTSRFYLRVPELQMSYSDLTEIKGIYCYQDSSPSNGHQGDMSY